MNRGRRCHRTRLRVSAVLLVFGTGAASCTGTDDGPAAAPLTTVALPSPAGEPSCDATALEGLALPDLTMHQLGLSCRSGG